MSGKSKTLDAELMDPGMSGNVTPAKRGFEPENDTIQPEKQPKLTTHEKLPIETSQQLIDVPGAEVEQQKAIRDDCPKEGYCNSRARKGYCKIHNCNTDHSTFTCPEKEKYFVLSNGVYILNYCALCKFGHLSRDCPLDYDGLDFI